MKRNILVMCSLERSHDFDPTSGIVSRIPTPLKSEPLVPPGVGVVQRRPESPGVVRSRLELESSRVVQSGSESFGVVWNRPELLGVGVIRNRLESFRVVQSRPESSGVVRSRSESFRVVRSRLESFGVVWSRLMNTSRSKCSDH